jgi:predicted lipoprotein with Yx(FWY)xxD motif
VRDSARSSVRHDREGWNCAEASHKEITMTFHSPSFRASAVLAGLAALALGVTACGSSGRTYSAGTNTSAVSTAPPVSASGPGANVAVANASGLGQIIVDGSGRTLYLFQADKGTTSSCSGACASAWPPVRATDGPTAGPGLNPSLLGTTSRSDGNRQVTYNGHPLYTYAGDKNPGEANGQGVSAFGGGWFVLSPAGTQISAGTSRTDAGYP